MYYVTFWNGIRPYWVNIRATCHVVNTRANYYICYTCIAYDRGQLNLVVEGNVSQSTTYLGHNAEKAIDGNADGIFAHQSCAMSSKENYPWWKVTFTDVICANSMSFRLLWYVFKVLLITTYLLPSLNTFISITGTVFKMFNLWQVRSLPFKERYEWTCSCNKYSK